jgi:hypothetical protein
MKKLLTLLFVVAFCGNLFSQGLPTDAETKKFTFQETVPLDSVTRDVIYERCKYWIANYYKTDKYDLDDKLNYKVSKGGNFSIKLTYDFKYKSDNNVSYTITLNQKEGKYRYTITDFKIYNVSTGAKSVLPLEAAYAKMSAQNKSETSSQITKEVGVITDELKKVMKTGKIESKEDW